MTTIRKIVTSKIDGDHANNTNTNEIRPFGEAAFYQNTSEGNGGPSKLELLIFDGVRTHLKSKVLAKGRFYGGDADSGDGSGLDTIKLIPDAALHYNDGSFGNDQYLIVDPTAPNHIHLRAGGTIDQSNADLFLGGERNHVRVSDSYDNVQITTDAGEGTYTWTFDNSGQLLIPGSSNGRITEDEPGVVVYSDTGFAVQTNAGSPVSSYQVEFIGFIDDGFGMGVAGATLHVTQMIAGTITDGMTIYGNGLAPEGWTLSFGSAFEPVGAGGTGYYTLNGANYLTSSQSFNNNVPEANGPKNWIFGTDGVLSFPDGSQQTTAASLDQLEVDGRTILTTIDDAIVVQTSRYPTISVEAFVGSSTGILVIDISADDDVTVVNPTTWQINTGTEQAPIWSPVVSVVQVPGEIFTVEVTGAEFIPGFTYTFRNTEEDTYQWTYMPNGTLVAPSGVILSSEYQAGNPNYRDFSIEMLEPGDAFEHRWIFRNDATLSIPGDLEFEDGTRQSTAVKQGEYLFEFDGVNTDVTIADLNFNLIFAKTAIGYSGSDTHNVNLPSGTLGQRLVVVNISTFCTLTINGGPQVTVGSGPAEFIYTSVDGWVPLYGTV